MQILVQNQLIDTSTIKAVDHNKELVKIDHGSYTTIIRCDTVEEATQLVKDIWTNK